MVSGACRLLHQHLLLVEFFEGFQSFSILDVLDNLRLQLPKVLDFLMWQ